MSFCIILPIFSCLSKKTPIKPKNPKKPTWLGFLIKNPGFFNPGSWTRSLGLGSLCWCAWCIPFWFLTWKPSSQANSDHKHMLQGTWWLDSWRSWGFCFTTAGTVGIGLDRGLLSIWFWYFLLIYVMFTSPVLQVSVTRLIIVIRWYMYV